MMIEIKDGTVIEEFWTLSKEVQNKLLIKAIRGSRDYGQAPNEKRYHAIIRVDGWDDLIDATYTNKNQRIVWKKSG